MAKVQTDSGHGMAAYGRLVAMLCVLVLLISLPFVLWGAHFDAEVPRWLASVGDALGSAPAFAAAGIALLMLDVLLPVPSTLVAVALCWRLGPLWGGASVAAGGALSFLAGYALGRLMPEARLRRWIGPALWDRVAGRAQRHAGWWIVLARPLPVLAELSAVLAGAWRLPLPLAFAQAALASLAMGALYGGSAWLGAQAPGLATSLGVLLILPVAFWCAHRLWLRRLGDDAGPDARQDDGA